MGSAAVGLVGVAAWRLDGYVERRILAWDRAAGGIAPPEGVHAGGPILAAAPGVAAALDALVRRLAGAEDKRRPRTGAGTRTEAPFPGPRPRGCAGRTPQRPSCDKPGCPAGRGPSGQ